MSFEGNKPWLRATPEPAPKPVVETIISPELAELREMKETLTADFLGGKVTKKSVAKLVGHAHSAMSSLHGKERAEAEEVWKHWSSMEKSLFGKK